MTKPIRLASSSSWDSADPALGQLVDDLTRRIQAGHAVDFDAVLAAHPRHTAALEHLLPALELLADLGCSITPTSGRSVPADSLAEGELLGGYPLSRELGRGGMGVVYEAMQSHLSRPVALKVILAGEFASASEVKRFQAEAEAIAQLDHPNIVPIYEVGEDRGRPFFCMKLYLGGSLAEHLQRYRDDPRRAAHTVATVARAVHHAHQRGILHRDLKPSNILLDAVNEPCVADFGLARQMNRESELTRSDALLGSPSYMAPEQTVGRRGECTVTTDVYGLGAVLYALLTGRPPFRAETALETMDQVRHRAPDALVGPSRRVDQDLQTICLKCLAKDPQERYESARALAEDLSRWLQGEPILARPASLVHRIKLWSRRIERIRDAGLLALGLGLLFTLYASTGLLLLGLGTIAIPRPDRFAIHLLKFIGLGYLPWVVVGWSTLQGRRWPIPAGILLGVGGATYFVAFLLGLFTPDVGGAYNLQDPTLVIAYHLLLISFCLLLALLYSVALAADRSNRGARTRVNRD